MIPKFRAWDKKVKEMIEDVASIHFKTEMITTSNFYFYPFKDIELMQSTGLHDVNGKEIFEGDILEVSYDDIHGEFCGCDIVAKNPSDYSLTEANWLNHAYEIEVIGNIHEHPELLENI